MSVETVKAYLAQYGLADRVHEFEGSSATVALAAQELGVQEARIAKTLAFRAGEGCILVVAAGDAKVDNRRFKEQFGCKATMTSPEETLQWTGHAVGGVCPFDLPDHGIEVYLDQSLRRFETVFPACGSSSSAVELTLDELERCAHPKGDVDVCKGWREEEQ